MSAKTTNSMHGGRILRVVGGIMVTALLTLLLLPPQATWADDLLHNSAGTGSTKWAGQGGWGVAGGKYGQFTCATCHEPNNKANIKNVRTVVSSMNGENLPNGAPSVSVSYKNVTSLGDDTGSHATSNRICEVCHSANKFHNSNTANNINALRRTAIRRVPCLSSSRHIPQPPR